MSFKNDVISLNELQENNKGFVCSIWRVVKKIVLYNNSGEWIWFEIEGVTRWPCRLYHLIYR